MKPPPRPSRPVVSCDGPWTALLMLTGMVGIPFAVPLLLIALHARRRGSPWAALAAASLAGGAFVFWLQVASHYPAEPPVVPVLFLPPFVAWAVAVLRPTRLTRAVAVAAAAVPLVGVVAFGVWRRLAYVPCV